MSFLHPFGQEGRSDGQGVDGGLGRRRVLGGAQQQHAALHIPVGHDGRGAQYLAVAALQRPQPAFRPAGAVYSPRMASSFCSESEMGRPFISLRRGPVAATISSRSQTSTGTPRSLASTSA